MTLVMIVLAVVGAWLLVSFLVALLVGRISHRAEASRMTLRFDSDPAMLYTTSTGAVGGLTR